VDLFWLPLGAGGRFVRSNGRFYEALAARLEHRERSPSITPRSKFISAGTTT
jgi:hypothetical protein